MQIIKVMVTCGQDAQGVLVNRGHLQALRPIFPLICRDYMKELLEDRKHDFD